MSPKETLLPLGMVTQWSVPRTWLMDGKSEVLPLLKKMRWSCRRIYTWTRGLGCTSWGESANSYPEKSMARGLLSTSSQLTGGKAISLNYMALRYKGWLHKSR